jgi:hypothetical protein
MNEFDRLLETQLRRFLDPIVATPPPARRARAEPKQQLIVLPEKLIAVPAEVLV